VERQINQKGLAGHVHLAGQQTYKYIRRAYHAAHLVVLPSQNEMLPRVMLEAWACGVPFMGTPIGSIPDYLVDGYNGYRVNPLTAQNLCDKISGALANQSERAVISVQARLDSQQFDWQKIAKKYMHLYQEMSGL
jgi:UDP-glucose:(heptosyl)LPS alpha-1,3-glucosyltransferase